MGARSAPRPERDPAPTLGAGHPGASARAGGADRPRGQSPRSRAPSGARAARGPSARPTEGRRAHADPRALRPSRPPRADRLRVGRTSRRGEHAARGPGTPTSPPARRRASPVPGRTGGQGLRAPGRSPAGEGTAVPGRVDAGRAPRLPLARLASPDAAGSRGLGSHAPGPADRASFAAGPIVLPCLPPAPDDGRFSPPGRGMQVPPVPHRGSFGRPPGHDGPSTAPPIRTGAGVAGDVPGSGGYVGGAGSVREAGRGPMEGGPRPRARRPPGRALGRVGGFEPPGSGAGAGGRGSRGASGPTLR